MFFSSSTTSTVRGAGAPGGGVDGVGSGASTIAAKLVQIAAARGDGARYWVFEQHQAVEDVCPLS